MPTYENFKRQVPTQIAARQVNFPAALKTALQAIGAVALLLDDGTTVRDGDYIERVESSEPGDYKYKVIPKAVFEAEWEQV